MKIVDIQFKKLYDDVEIPKYATEGSSGFDLVVHNFKKGLNIYDQMLDISSNDSILLLPHHRVLVGCGWACAIPEDFEIQVRTRSGMALKQGLIILNAPGTIDSDYRGEMGLILHNDSPFEVQVKKGDRLGQGIVVPVYKANFEVVESLDETTRGEGGYGSTGTDIKFIKSGSTEKF